MACVVVSTTALRAQLLAGLLAQCGPAAIAAACDSATAAIAAIDGWQPELVILDRDGDSDDCERIARHLLRVAAGARLILLSPDPRLDALRRELGSRVTIAESWTALLRGVRFSSAGATHLQRLDSLPELSCFDRLRPRERAVLELVGSGLGSREIAAVLGLSTQTVETYRKSVSAKLGVSGARLVRIAVLWSCVQHHRVCFPAGSLAGDGGLNHLGDGERLPQEGSDPLDSRAGAAGASLLAPPS